ncbi:MULTISPECIES: deoxyribonuclease I [Corallococcus]|uniref:deoxyribonuclease I n=1 Tax=Corallococcus TaxID=83461 RepID=UPI00118134D7|nr:MULTISPECIES: deoxyribonuclease I [Corallococcus]NBD10078.1 deoxyribonuclease I [Corallococcus silvisoli]TSC28436.1 deoxyribonuclease I [Corallococcus sp. Z5C101001]
MRGSSFVSRVLVLTVLVLPALAQAGSYLRVVSWNLRHEGWAAEQTYLDDARQIWNQFGSNSTSNNGCDLVFLQEVMSTAAAQAIAQNLTQVSGVAWTAVVTPLLGRSSYKESYAVLYRTDTVSLLSSTVWNDTADLFEREPQVVKVRHLNTGADYTFLNWHTVWGTAADRQLEAQAIDDVFTAVQSDSSTDQDVILVGDHNMPCTHASWSQLKAVSPAVTCKLDVPTTLNTSGGFANAYDHFWMQDAYVTEFSSTGRDYIADTKDYVTRLSDHAPVWLSLYSTSDTD